MFYTRPNVDAVLEWETEQKTEPISFRDLGDFPRIQDSLIKEGQECYFCGSGYLAVTRTREGHPICEKCVENGIPGR